MRSYCKFTTEHGELIRVNPDQVQMVRTAEPDDDASARSVIVFTGGSLIVKGDLDTVTSNLESGL